MKEKIAPYAEKFFIETTNAHRRIDQYGGVIIVCSADLVDFLCVLGIDAVSDEEEGACCEECLRFFYNHYDIYREETDTYICNECPEKMVEVDEVHND